MPKSSWNVPPRPHDPEFYNFLLEFFQHVYGVGDDNVGGILDSFNLPTTHGAGTDPNDHGKNLDTALDSGGTNEVTAVNAKDAVDKKHTAGTDPNDHDPGTNHKIIIQATDPTDIGALVTTGTADGTYSSNEQTMLNNIKTDLTTTRTKINTLLANQRTAKQIA